MLNSRSPLGHQTQTAASTAAPVVRVLRTVRRSTVGERWRAIAETAAWSIGQLSERSEGSRVPAGLLHVLKDEDDDRIEP